MSGAGGEGGWWVYLLECEGGRLYTGIARDPERRFREHASGRGARFTRAFRPVRLLGALPCEGRSGATRLERRVRTLPPAGKRALFPGAGAGGAAEGAPGEGGGED